MTEFLTENNIYYKIRTLSPRNFIMKISLLLILNYTTFLSKLIDLLRQNSLICNRNSSSQKCH